MIKSRTKRKTKPGKPRAREVTDNRILVSYEKQDGDKDAICRELRIQKQTLSRRLNKQPMKDKYWAVTLMMAKGNIQRAALKLGISREHLSRCVNDDKKPFLKMAQVEGHEARCDWVEDKLDANIKLGKERSIIYFLETKAKHRGYARGLEIGGLGGGPVVIKRTVTYVRAPKR